MHKPQKQTLKQILSWFIGIPAALVAFSEPKEISYWWVSILGWTVLVGILAWNNLLNIKEETNESII